MPRSTSKLARAMALLAVMGAAACTNPAATEGNYTTPIGSAPALSNPSLYSGALSCLALDVRAQDRQPTFTVGKVLDYTGKDDIETGKRLTQGASLMVMSALGKAGVDIVERFDTSVTELELKFADNKLIGDGNGGIQQIFAGQIDKSDYHIIGGITELNYNLRSTNGEVLFDIFNASGRLFVMNVGLDLRLVETGSLRVVDTISLQKQVIGREVRAGLFEFFDDKLLDLGVGERALEPLQLAVRSVAERAVYEMVRKAYGIPGSNCARFVRGADEQLDKRDS